MLARTYLLYLAAVVYLSTVRAQNFGNGVEDGFNCPKAGYMFPDPNNLCVVWYCAGADVAPIKRPCPKGVRVPSWWDGGELNMCFVVNIAKHGGEPICLRCDAYDVPPQSEKCASNPCPSECECEDTEYTFRCDCPDTGIYVEDGSQPFPVDHCSPNICENGASCQNQWDGFFCFCPPGWTGHRCEQSVCDWHPCDNGGTCVIDDVGFHCECTECWTGSCCNVTVPGCDPTITIPCPTCLTGRLCETQIDSCECSPGVDSFCEPGQVCVNVLDGKKCEVQCDEKCYFPGCKIKRDNCECSNNCPAKTRCEDLFSDGQVSHECLCDDVCYEGGKCDSKKNNCECNNPCPNQSQCQDTNAGPHCACDECFKGDKCDEPIWSCTCNSQCTGSSSCRLTIDGTPECYCDNSCRLGNDCSIVRNTCECANPCTSEQVCEMSNDQPTCVCANSCMTGDYCNESVSSCKCSNPCSGNEVCVDDPTGPKCVCTNDKCSYGPGCLSILDTCECSNPCTNEQVCKMVNNRPTCECASSCMTGENCDVPVVSCQCNNGGCGSETCVETSSGVTCQCADSCMEGADCRTRKNTCECSPCDAGELCREQNGVKSECYCSNPCQTGPGCTQLIQSCGCANPCGEGQQCSDSTGVVKCGCLDSCLTGSDCSERVNTCDCNSPCSSSEECFMDNDNELRCRCTDYCKTGPGCQETVNRCACNNPCNDRQTCLDTDSGPVCECTDSCHLGEDCSQTAPTCDCAKPCTSAQICIDLVEAYSCSCTDKCMVGLNCNERVKSCDCQPCESGELCDDRSGEVICSCADSCTVGPGCLQKLNTCDCSNPCNSNQQCYEDNDGLKCSCSNDCMSGPNCDQPINTCRCQKPCEGQGTCVDTSEGPKCENCINPCNTGDRCDETVNVCACNNPCSDESTCRNTPTGPTCDCPRCYTGPDCSTRVDSCDCNSNRCGEYGECREGPDGLPQCSCVACYRGDLCEERINSCACRPNTCDEGKNCVDVTEPGYSYTTCECPSCSTGPNCNQQVSSCECKNPCDIPYSCTVTDEGPTCVCDCQGTETCSTNPVTGYDGCRCPKCYRNKEGERGCNTRITNRCECNSCPLPGQVCRDNDDPNKDIICEEVIPSSGNIFTVMFEENNTEKPFRTVPLELYFSSAKWDDGPRSVQVTTMGLDKNHYCYNTSVVEVKSQTVFRYPVERCLMHNRTGLDHLAIQVREVNNKTIVVYGINKDRWTADGFLAIPDEKAGTLYQTVSFSPAHIATQFGIVALFPQTIVEMTLADDNNLEAPYNKAGSTYVQFMNAYDTFQVQARCLNQTVSLQTECLLDLTGSVIKSNRPIHVFSGNVRSWVPGKAGNSRDHLVEQLFSVDKWGMDFAIVTIPNRVVGDIIQIMAQNGQATRCLLFERYGSTLTNPPSERQQWEPTTIELPTPAGKYHINRDIPSGGMYRLKCNSAVFVTQITKSMDVILMYKNETVHDPVTITVPPVTQFTNNFMINTPQFTGGVTLEPQPYNTTYALMVAVRGTEVGIELNNKPISPSQFDIPWTVLPNGDEPSDAIYVGAAISISHGTNIIRNKDGNNFQCLVYGHDNRESYGFPAGMALTKFVL